MTQQSLTWVGLQVEDYLIHSLINDGPFSWVYKGSHLSEGSNKAFKVAKPREVVSKVPDTSVNLTQAKAIYEGGAASVSPDTRDLLLLHANKMQNLQHESLIAVESLVDTSDICYIKMDYVEGQTLRQLMNSGPVAIDTLITIAATLQELLAIEGYEYHGDLRPDNIVVVGNEIKLLDSGYFGPLNCQEGADLDCAVTNVFYYPTLEPDDTLALGFLLWEAACRQHPLTVSQGSAGGQIIGDSLESWIGLYESVGQHFLSPMRHIARPDQLRPGLPEPVQEMILAAMGLTLNGNGRLQRLPSAPMLDTTINSLKMLQRQGITSL